SNEEFALSEVDQRTVGRRIGPPQAAEDHTRRISTRIGEQLPDHDLKQIAACEGRSRSLDQCGILTRTVVALARSGGPAPEAIRISLSGPWQTTGGGSGDLKLVPVDRRRLPHVVDDQDLVRQKEDKVSLVVGSRQAQPHRLELEHQIIS